MSIFHQPGIGVTIAACKTSTSVLRSQEGAKAVRLLSLSDFDEVFRPGVMLSGLPKLVYASYEAALHVGAGGLPGDRLRLMVT